MAINLPITRLVNVTVDLSPAAAQAQNLSDLLVLGTSDIIDVVERIRTYSSIDEVAAEFGTSAVEYLCAVLWFEQAPQPTQLKIGRWAQTDTQAVLNGGALSTTQQAIATFAAVTSPGFLVYINGTPYAIAPASFAGSTNLNGIASKIQTALNSAVSASTCVWDAINSRFQIQSGTAGDESTLSFLSAPHAVGSIVFSANPANNSTITLNGTAVTFVSASPTSGQVLIGATLADTLAALLVVLNASTDTQLVKFTYSLNSTPDTLQLVAATAGSGGNALTLVASSSPASHGTVSAGTLAGGSGTSIAAMLGMTSTFSGAYIADGIDAESAVDATALFDANYGQTWYALTMPTATNDDTLDVAAYIEAATNKHIFGVSTQEAGVISSVDTSNIAYLLKQLRYKRTSVQYSSENAYSVCSLFGRILTVNYNGNNTTITVMYKQEPGIVAESLTPSQASAAQANNANVFVAYNNNTAIIQYGTMASGDFIDIITGTDWLAVTIMTAVFNLLYTSPTKIPQTDAGTHLIVNTISAVCSQGVTNGLSAPGTWTSNGFGTLKSGDFLAAGFYIYAPLVATQLQADREARKSVPIQVAFKLAGAVQTVDIAITVNR